jgi:hypothetical protein
MIGAELPYGRFIFGGANLSSLKVSATPRCRLGYDHLAGRSRPLRK